MAISCNGSLFGWGSNKFGQIGAGKEYKIVREIKKIDIPFPIESVATQFRHSIVLCSNGIIIGFGETRHGQLGKIPSENDKKKNRKKLMNQSALYLPTQLFDLLVDHPIKQENIVSVKVGMKHSIFLSNSNSIWVIGDNKFSQLGDSSITSPCYEPIRLSFGMECNEIYCGWNHSVILGNNKHKLILFGRNNYGQLGCLNPKSIRNEIEFVDSIKSVSTGSEHCLVLLQTGKLLAWGWNEHGQLGLGNEDNYFFPKEHSNLYDYISCGTAQCFGKLKEI